MNGKKTYEEIPFPFPKNLAHHLLKNCGWEQSLINRDIKCSVNRGVDYAAQNLLNVLIAVANDNPTANVTYTSFQLGSNYTMYTPLKDCIDSLNKVPILGDGSPEGTVFRGFKLEIYRELLTSINSYTK